ncbi:CBS domain-containing protein cbsx3, mitochondrial [Salvia divinorum]|uniref:CBS domain-containing protein cbsx3, mitochondrial n=1 Tax=Salvia divinorum TaxID=28513 RepID=A0ABD1G601_SALDI
MQGLLQKVRFHCEHIMHIKKQNCSASGSILNLTKHPKGLNGSRPETGLHNTTVAEVLSTKGQGKAGSWLWCRTDDTVYDAVKQMAHNNIGSLVVLKPGEQHHIAGILTERDYLRKVIVKDRSSLYTKVGEIMTNQDKLVTVTSDTNILHAMQLMTENQIRHAPVIDGKIVGMISIVDVVRAVVEQQHEELKRLNEFIRGDYY